MPTLSIYSLRSILLKLPNQFSLLSCIQIIEQKSWGEHLIKTINHFMVFRMWMRLLINILVQMIRDILDDAQQVRPVFEQLRRNFYTGATRSLQARKAALKNLLEGYVALEGHFNDALKKDLGHNEFIANFEAHNLTKAEIKDLIGGISSWIKPQSVPTPIGLGMASCEIQREPLGVALVISAWNYPIYTAIPQAAAAICAGNCVILKPSELASECSGVIKKLFDEYMDPKYYRVIQGKVQVAKALTKLPVDIICFTGSTMTGRLVAIEAAKNLVPCILELGGKCPVIVDETAKIGPAVNRILFGKFLNCGQTCIGVDHIYVHLSIRSQFQEVLNAKLEQFFGGQQNLQQDGNYGKIINRFHVDRIQKYLKDDHGGKIVYGGKAINKETRFISPVVIQSPSKDSLLMQQEIFGPILPIFYYDNLDEVIKEIVSRPKPLVVYHFSQSSAHTKLVRQRTYSGAYVINDTVVQMTNLHLPFGGVGASGYGRYHGKDGFIAFTNPKSIAKISSMDNYPLNQRYPPYNESKKSMMNALLKWSTITYGQIAKVVLVVILLIAIGVTIGILAG